MLALLNKLHETTGRLVARSRTPKGYEVRSQKDENWFWFPTRAAHGVQTRGLVDDRGFITELGLKVIGKQSAST